MKKFRKTTKGLFICEECGRTFRNYQGLRTHIRHSHSNLSQKNYYDKWIKDENDDKCKICGKQTEFDSLLNGYKECCNRKHTNLYAYKKKADTMKKKYGYENQYQREDIKSKNKEKHLKNLGVENPRQSKLVQTKAKERCKLIYGDENYNNPKKAKETCLQKYGVEHPNQNQEQYNKSLKTRLLIHQYKDTKLFYQGSYEYDFLEKYYSSFPNIERGPSIKYRFNGQNKVYHPDFFIPLLNLIIEIKSSWTLTGDTEISEKKKSTLINGYNYIIIVDKNYDEFEKLLRYLVI